MFGIQTELRGNRYDKYYNKRFNDGGRQLWIEDGLFRAFQFETER
jgi:hypothetical protein